MYVHIHMYCKCCHCGCDRSLWAVFGDFTTCIPTSDGLPVPFLSTSRAVDDHYQLVPYFLTIGADALKKGTSAMIPLAKHESFIDKVHTIYADVHGYLLCATSVCGCVCMHARLCIVSYIHVCVEVGVCMRARMCIVSYIHVCVEVGVCMRACVCIVSYIHVCVLYPI